MDARRAVACVWVTLAMPFVVAGVWTPVSHALGGAEAVTALPLTAGVGICGLVASLAPPGRGRTLGVLLAACGFALLGGGPSLAAIAAAVLLAAVGAATASLATRCARALPADLGWPRRSLTVPWLLLAALALVHAVRLSAFLIDPSFHWGAIQPWAADAYRHCCLTSYAHGVVLAERGMDLYDPVYDTLALGPDAPLPPTAAHMAPFTLDLFGYSPAFLLAPGALMVLTPDFVSLRAVFVLVSALGWGACLWFTGTYLGGTTWRRLLWIGPLTLCTIPLFLSLQFANFSVLLVLMGTGAWLLARGQRAELGGALVAFATLTRYTPALLALILVLQRRWRAVMGGALATLVLVGMSIALFGPSPWYFFVHTLLPELASGEVMGFWHADPLRTAINVSPLSLPFKLSGLGLVDWGWPAARWIDRGFTVALLGATLLAARQRGDERHQLLLWSSVLMLGAVKSSFAGPHVMVQGMLLLLLLLPEVRGTARTVAYLVAWLIVGIGPVASPVPVMMTFGVLQTVLVLVGTGWLLLRAPVDTSRLDSGTPECLQREADLHGRRVDA